MTKRVLSVLLAVILLMSVFSVLPTAATAAEEETVITEDTVTEVADEYVEDAPGDIADNKADLADTGARVIDTITISGVVEPYGGKKPSYTANVPAGAGYKLPTYSFDDIVNGVSWEDFRGGGVKKTDTFQAGLDYTVNIYLYPATDDDTFEMNGSLNVTVNGKAPTHYYRGKNSEGICYVWLECSYTCLGKAIGSVAVNGIIPPYAGQHPDYSAAVPSGQGYEIADPDYISDTWENGLLWEDENDNSVKKTDSFVAGKKYTVNIYLDPASKEYYFNEKLSSYKVNGSSENVMCYHGVNSYNTPYILLECTFTCQALPAGKVVKGTQTSFLDNGGTVHIRLYQGGMLKQSTASYGNTGNFMFVGVPAGTYTLRLTKTNHVTRDYTIKITDNSTYSNLKIHPLGDISGDGKVSTKDFGMAYAHAQKLDTLTGYQLKCGDVVKNDGKITTTDAARINAHVQKTDLLW